MKRNRPALDWLGDFVSKLSFSFDVIAEENAVAVEDCVGKEFDPVAKNNSPAIIADLAIHLYMPVPKDKVVDVGVRLQIFIGEDDEFFLERPFW